MKYKKNGERYNDDFHDLSNEYGVSEVTIYKWIKDFTPVDESVHLKKLLRSRKKI